MSKSTYRAVGGPLDGLEVTATVRTTTNPPCGFYLAHRGSERAWRYTLASGYDGTDPARTTVEDRDRTMAWACEGEIRFGRGQFARIMQTIGADPYWTVIAYEALLTGPPTRDPQVPVHNGPIVPAVTDGD